jgi:hypothetical protein
MAFSGGTFSRTFDCTTDRDNGIKILASKFDTELDGMAVGLSTAILKDGTQTCTAAIPFAQGITLPDDKTIAFGTNSDVLIQYDETTTDSLKISAAEGAGLAITLMADEGDDAGDEWKLNIADGGTLTLGNDINSAGTYVTHLTITPNATVANSTMAVAGNLTVGGDLTLGSGAVITEAELEMIDGITPGTVLASKAMVVDANKDITGGRNLTITGELDAATLDISGNADIDGTLEADAMTLNGTPITTVATLSTGISNGNLPVFTSGAADNDFLRIDGTAIEGRSAAEVLSDIAAAPAAGSSNIVTTGALNSGSITSGFGAIDNGASAITTTGVITGGTLEATADTSAGDNAAIGYTSAEGLILTGQGSTSDITLKNDADATVFTVPTGTDDILFPDGAKAMFGAGSDLQIYHDGSDSIINDAGTGSLKFQYGGTDGVVFDSSGNVGIGAPPNATFGSLLYTQGTPAANKPIVSAYSQGNSNNAGFALFNDNGNRGIWTTGSTMRFTRTYEGNSTADLTIDASGNVGIGGVPGSKLNVISATSGGISIAQGTENFYGASAHRFFTDGYASEVLRIDSSGNLLVGTTSSLGNYLTVGSSSVAGSSGHFDRSGDGGLVRFYRTGSEVGSISVASSSTAYNTSSDYRLKTAVEYDWDATTRLKQLKPARFEWISEGDDAVPVDGFLAHEVEDIVPEAITGTKDAMRDEEYEVSAATGDIYTPAIEAVLDEDGNEVTPAVAEVIHSTDAERPEELAEGQQWRETKEAVMGTRSVPDYQGIDQSKVVPLLTKALIESVAKIEALEARIAALEAG